MKDLEKRMYFLVPYNISPIQQAIQAGHAALEYAHHYKDDPETWEFVRNHKTWIVLNGGTTNKTRIEETGLLKGSLDNCLGELCAFNVENPDNQIKFSYFYEPDLNDALTAICLVVDERVFNREDYPNFKEWCLKHDIFWAEEELLKEKAYKEYKAEVGKDIAFLKELLNTKKLA